MIKKLRTIFKSRDDLSRGFTLIEVLVAIFIGLIVMGMAVSILGITNSTVLRVLAKSEAQLNTRASMVNSLDKLANAQSIDQCRVGSSEVDQIAVQGNPLRSGIAEDNCKETSPSGVVIAFAEDNKLCYFVKNKIPTPPDVQCIAKGGEISPSNSFPIPSSPGSFTIDVNCINPPAASNDRLVYLYTCKASSGNHFNFPNSFIAPTSNEISVIADLGPQVPPTPLPIFEYITVDGGNHLTDRTSIIAVDVNLQITYEDYRPGTDGVYSFSETIVLRGSNQYLAENYDGF